MYGFKEIPFDEDNQEKLQNLLDIFRKMRNAQIFNNPMFQDILKSPEFEAYIEETYIVDKDRWN